jgi:hypothetical protein
MCSVKSYCNHTSLILVFFCTPSTNSLSCLRASAAKLSVAFLL